VLLCCCCPWSDTKKQETTDLVVVIVPTDTRTETAAHRAFVVCVCVRQIEKSLCVCV